ncbi:MAG TPA: hypothetical protein VHR47_12295, partial [Bacillota bacterium]|nr:hypothetical protein [Bacillota bacterium]
AVDEQLFIEEGFQMGDKYYIPGNILYLWGFTPGSAFIDGETLVKEYGVQVTPYPGKITVKTIRVYFANKLSPVRGRFIGEPLIAINDLIGSTKTVASFNSKSKILVYGGRLIKDCLVYNNRGWLGISRLNELNLSAHWDPVQLRVDITSSN